MPVERHSLHYTRTCARSVGGWSETRSIHTLSDKELSCWWAVLSWWNVYLLAYSPCEYGSPFVLSCRRHDTHSTFGYSQASTPNETWSSITVQTKACIHNPVTSMRKNLVHSRIFLIESGEVVTTQPGRWAFFQSRYNNNATGHRPQAGVDQKQRLGYCRNACLSSENTYSRLLPTVWCLDNQVSGLCINQRGWVVTRSFPKHFALPNTNMAKSK